MPHASAIAPADNCIPSVASVLRLDRRPWPVRVRTCAASKGLPPATRGFAVLLSTYFDATGRWALSIDQLADATGLTRRQVYVHLKRCKDADLFDVQGGGGSFRNRYSVGPALCPMAAAEPTPKTARGGVQKTAPVRIRSGSQSTGSKHNSTDSTGPTTPRHDPRDDDRITCPECGNSWPRRFGSKCIPCSKISTDVPGNRPIVTKAGKATDIRHECLSCGNSWPTKYGMKCKKCGLEHDPTFKPLTAEQLAALKKRQAASTGVVCGRCYGVYDSSVPGAGILGKCPNCRDISDTEAANIRKVKGAQQRAAYWAARLPLAGDVAEDRASWHAERAQATADAILSARVNANTVGGYHHGC